MTVQLHPHDYLDPILHDTEPAAIELVELGFHVFPAPASGESKSHKSAARSGGRPWGATDDPEEVRRDWVQWPGANVGIRTGAASGVFVLDVDSLEGHGVDGHGSLGALERENGPLPRTVEAVSPSGGRHLYFRYPDSLVVRNSASQIAPGIDVRGEGGMVLAPPSTKPGKGSYRWVRAPYEFDLADAPGWLLELARKDRPEPAAPPQPRSLPGTDQYAERVLEACADEVSNAANGARNDTLNKIAYRIGRFVGAGRLRADDVTSTLEHACGDCGLWKDDGARQCRATIESGLQKGAASPCFDGLATDPTDGFTAGTGTGTANVALEAQADDAAIVATSWRRQNLVTMPAREFLYGRLLQRGKVTVTVAPGGVGKSALTNAAEALAMVTGRKLLHDAVYEPLTVWVWNLEEDQDELNRRLEAVCLHYGIAGDVGELYVDNGFDMPCRMAVADRAGTHIVRPITDAIVAELKRLKVDVLVIDPFVSTHSVPENDNGAIDAVAKEWARVANEAQCAIHLVHHTAKLRGFEATVEHSRGAIALVNAARFARALNPMTEDEANTFGIKEGWRYFRATDGKANYTPRAEASQWFCHASVHLPNGDNVGVVTPFTLPNMTDGVTSTDLDEVVRRAGEREGPERYREAIQSPDWVGYMIADVIGQTWKCRPKRSG